MQEGGASINWRLIKSMLTNCIDMLVFGANLDDMIFCGPKLVTDVWITPVTADHIVMWVTRLSIVDWVYSKTQILLTTLRTENQPREEGSYVFLETELLSPLVGCARSKRQCRTVLQNQKSFRWMLDCEWMDYLLSIYGML